MGAITRAAANNFTTNGVILPAAINDTSVASVTELENVSTGGAFNLISEQTASASAEIEFSSGIDSTYPIYMFEYISCHPSTDQVRWSFNFSTDGGSSYNVTKTSTFIYHLHRENDAQATFAYNGDPALAQQTGDQRLNDNISNNNDCTVSGTMFLYDPSSTTFVKNFMARGNAARAEPLSEETFVAGYGNTTSAINAIKFYFSSGNIDSGTVKMYGISGS